MKRRGFLAILVALSGCASMDAGGASGPLASISGRQAAPDGRLAVSIVSAMDGGLIGSIVGDISERDRRRGLEAEYRALEHTPSGQPVAWRNSDSSRSGEVIAAAPYRVGSQDCRQYRHTVHIGSETKEARGTACRNSNGSWTPLT